MIGRNDERGSGISALGARHDDDDDDVTRCTRTPLKKQLSYKYNISNKCY